MNVPIHSLSYRSHTSSVIEQISVSSLSISAIDLKFSSPENKSLIRDENSKEFTINHKGTNTVEDAED